MTALALSPMRLSMLRRFPCAMPRSRAASHLALGLNVVIGFAMERAAPADLAHQYSHRNPSTRLAMPADTKVRARTKPTAAPSIRAQLSTIPLVSPARVAKAVPRTPAIAFATATTSGRVALRAFTKPWNFFEAPSMNLAKPVKKPSIRSPPSFSGAKMPMNSSISVSPKTRTLSHAASSESDMTSAILLNRSDRMKLMTRCSNF
jgi:hypothetical protein